MTDALPQKVARDCQNVTGGEMNVEVFRRVVLALLLCGAQALAASDGQLSPAAAAQDHEETEIRRLLTEARYADAEARARALVLTRDGASGDSVAVARALDLLVQALVEGGKPQDPDALPSATRAVALKERVLGATDPALASSLSNLGLVFRRQGKLVDARAAYDRALAIREAALGHEHPDVARTLAALSALAAAAGDFTRARDLGSRALTIAERLHPPDGVLVAGAANNLAQALFQMGEYAESKRLVERALRAYEGALGPDHPEVGRTLSNLATVVSETGDLVSARTLYERATRIQEQRQGPDHPDVALNRNNLADVFFLLGDYPQAAALFERALQSLEHALGPQHTRVAMVLGNLAQVHVAQGNYAAARPLYARALDIREAAVGRDHPSLVYTLTGYGELHVRLGDYEMARTAYERALAIAEEAYGAEHAMTALVLQGLGDLLLARGDVTDAEDRLARALAIRSKLLGHEHPLVAESRASLAIILARTGRSADALEAALEAERVARAHLQVTAQALDERQALSYAERRVDAGDIALSLLTSRASRLGAAATARAWDAVVRSRALVLEEMAARRRVVAGVNDPEVVRLANDLVAARQRLAGLLVRSAADPASRARIEQAARERDDAERALAERSLQFRTEIARTRISLEDAIAALPRRAALLAYARFRRSPLDPAPTQGGSLDNAAGADGRDEYGVFVARGDGTPPVFVPLGDAHAIDDAVSRWRGGILDETEAGRATGRTERIHRTAGVALRRLIWDPLAGAIAGQTQLFVVPAGPLHLVNWGALPAAGNQRYLIEEAPLLHYLSSERDLVPQPNAVGEGLLVVDDPAYAGTAVTATPRGPGTGARSPASPPPCGDLRDLAFDPLPGTRREGDAIAALWTSASRGARDADRRLVRLSGAQATEAAVRQSVAGKRVVHLATHGFFLGAWCDPPRGAPPTQSHPLLLAGLALTGAGERGSRPTSDDGVLLAEEIATLDFRGVDWAVLSACDTGAGVLSAGDELFGLRRVFQIAGVNTVILSLWPVDDETTQRWMTAVYDLRFVKGSPTAEALRTATVRAIARRRAQRQSTHPAYWASFIAAGKW